MKKNWKQITVALMLGLLLGTALGRFSYIGFDRHFGSHEKRMERKFKRFTKELNLTPDQQEKIKAIFKEKHGKIDMAREKTRPAYKAIREKAKQEIRALLTEDQIVKFNALEEKRKKWREKNKMKYGHHKKHR